MNIKWCECLCVFIHLLLHVLQVVSDGFPVVQAVVPKTQTRSFITQGSDILVMAI